MIRQFCFLSLMLFAACANHSVTPNTTPAWPQGCWNVKYVISGSNVPDSVDMNINRSSYWQMVYSPTLPLSDSTHFCGDLGSDVNIFLYDHDSTHVFDCSVYIDDTLRAHVTGNVSNNIGFLSIGAQCE